MRIKRFSVFILSLFLLAGLFSFILVFRNPQRLQAFLVEQADKKLNTHLSFDKASVVFRPFPQLQVAGLRIESAVEEFPALTAEQARFSFHPLPLLWGQLRLSGFRILEGNGSFEGIALDHVDFKIKNLNSMRPASFQGRGNLGDSPEHLKGEGTLSYKESGSNFWHGLELSGSLILESFSLEGENLKNFFGQPVSIPLSGEWSGTLQFQKERSREEIQSLLQFQVKNFHSQTPETFSPKGQAKIAWNPIVHLVEIQEISAMTPFGELSGSSILKTETGEIEDTRLTGHGIVLEELIRRFPNLSSAVPLDIGFSGQGEFDLTLQGTWDYLSFHANVDFTPSALTYKKFFSKPKDFPFGVVCDFLIKGGSLLSGDFSLRVQDATIKGTLKNLNLKNGDGELTILTNKFSLKAWETLLTPLVNYEVSGQSKALMSYKGDLIKLDKSLKIANITLEDVTLISPSGRGLRHTNGVLDFSPLSLRLKEITFQTGNSKIKLDAEFFNYQQGLQGNLRIQSPQLNFLDSIAHLKELRAVISNEPIWVWEERIERVLSPYFSSPLVLEEFNLEMALQQKKIIFQGPQFNLLEGDFSLKGEVDISSEKPGFWLEFEMGRIALARYLEGNSHFKNSLEGNLFFKGRLEGSGRSQEEISKTISGKGTLSITNGEWVSLDLVETLKTIEPFREFDFPRIKSLPFHDLKADWNYGAGKFDSRNFLILTNDFWIEGEGSLSFENVLNGRLEVYLSKTLTEKAFKFLDFNQDTENKQLGPIPILLVGPFEKPELRVASEQVEPFLEAVRTRRLRKFLHKPFSEPKRV